MKRLRLKPAYQTEIAKEIVRHPFGSAAAAHYLLHRCKNIPSMRVLRRFLWKMRRDGQIYEPRPDCFALYPEILDKRFFWDDEASYTVDEDKDLHYTDLRKHN